MKGKKKEEKASLRKMLLMWQELDSVKSGYIFYHVEKQNEAFARGWRYAIANVIKALDEFNL